jgi:hypothetical protein
MAEATRRLSLDELDATPLGDDLFSAELEATEDPVTDPLRVSLDELDATSLDEVPFAAQPEQRVSLDELDSTPMSDSEPDDEWKAKIKQAKPLEVLSLLESLPPDTKSIDAVDARKLIMNWRRQDFIKELASGDYEIDGVQLPKDYVHEAARNEVIRQFYNDFGAMRDVVMDRGEDADAVRAIDTFLTKHRPDIANSLRNQNPNYFGWDTRGKWQYALDAMKSAEGLLNMIDATLGFIPRGTKATLRNMATETRVADGQINIPESIRNAYRKSVTRDFLAQQPPIDSATKSLKEAPPMAAMTERYPYVQWTLRARKVGGGDPYQDKVVAPNLELAQELLTEQMRELGSEPKSFETISQERVRPAGELQGQVASDLPASPYEGLVPGQDYVTVSQDIARFAREGNQEAFEGKDIGDIRRRLGFREYWSMFPSYQGDEVSESLLQDVGRLAIGGRESGEEAELFAREGAATIAATAELPFQATRGLVEAGIMADQLSLEGLAREGWIDLPEDVELLTTAEKGLGALAQRAVDPVGIGMATGEWLIDKVGIGSLKEKTILSTRPELAAQVAEARERLVGWNPDQQLPGQTQFLKALAESGLGSLLPGDVLETAFLPKVADPTDFPLGEMIPQLGSDLADTAALSAIGRTGRTLMGSSPIPGYTHKGARQLERLEADRLKEASAMADELGLAELTDQMRNDALRLARIDFTQAVNAARENRRVLTDIQYTKTPEGRIQRSLDDLEVFDSQYVPRAAIETTSEANRIRNLIELKVQSERLTPSAGALMRAEVAKAGTKVSDRVAAAAEGGSQGAQMLQDVAGAAAKAGKGGVAVARTASRWAGMGWKVANSPNAREAMDEVVQTVIRRARSQEQLDDFNAKVLRGAPEIEGGVTAEDVETVFNMLEAQRHVVLNTDILETADDVEAMLQAAKALQDEVFGGNWLNIVGENANETVRVMRNGQMVDMTLREAAEQLHVLRGRQLTRELMSQKLGAFQTSTGDLTLEALQNQKPELVADYVNSFVDSMAPFYGSLLRLDEAPLIDAAQQRMVDALRGAELARERAQELRASIPKVQRPRLPKDADPGLKAALREQDEALNKVQAEAARIDKLADDHEMKALLYTEEIRTTLRAELREAKAGFQQSKQLLSGAERLERFTGAAPKRFSTYRDYVQDGINRRTSQIKKLQAAEPKTTNSVLRVEQLNKEVAALKTALGGNKDKLRSAIVEIRELAKKKSAKANGDSMAVDKRIIRKRDDIESARKQAKQERRRARDKRAEGGKLSKQVKKEYRDAAAVQYAERKAARAAADADVRAANDEALVLSKDAAESRKELQSIDKDIKVRARERAELEAYEEWDLPAILNEPVRGRRQMAMDEFAADLADAPVGLARPSRDADLTAALEGMPLAPEAARPRRWFFKAKLEGTKTPKTGYVTARTELEAKQLASARIKRMKRKVEGELEVTPPRFTRLEQDIVDYERAIADATGVEAEFLELSAQLAGKTPRQVVETLWENMDEAIQFDLQLAKMSGDTYSPKLGNIMRSMEEMTDRQKFIVTDLVKDRARAKAITGKRRAGESEKEFRARVTSMRRRYTKLTKDEERLLPLVKYFETYFDDYLVKLQKNGLLKDWDLYKFLDENNVSGYVHRTLSRAGVGQTRQVEAAYRRASGRAAVMNPQDSPILQSRGIPGTRDEVDDLMRWHVAEQLVRHNDNLKPNQLVSQRKVLDVYRELPQDLNFFEGNPFVAAATYGQHASKSIAMKIMFDDLLAIARARFEYADLANQASQGRKVIDPRTGQQIPQERAALDQWARLAGEKADHGQPIVRVTGPEYVSLLTGNNFPVGKDAVFDYMGVMIANGAKESEVVDLMKKKFGVQFTNDQARLITMGDVYLPQDVASFLKAWARPSMKQMLRGHGSTSGGAAALARGGALLLDVYDNMTALFKGFVTVVWPRFHGRNQIGGQFQNKMLYGANYGMEDQANALLLNMPSMDARVVKGAGGSEVIIPGTKQLRIDLGGPNRDPRLRSANLTLEEWRAIDREFGISTYQMGAADLDGAIEYYLRGSGVGQLKQLPAKTRREVEGFLERLKEIRARTADEGWKPVVWDEFIADLWKRLELEAKGSRLAKGDLSGPGGKVVTASGAGGVVLGGAAWIGAGASTPVLGLAATGAIAGALTQLTSKQLFRLGAEVARMSENHVRWANFSAGLRSGLTFEEAARNVNKALFNYNPAAQSWFSYEIMRRLHPFWTFRSKNFALYSEMLLKYPERMAVLEKVLANFIHHDGAAELKAGLPEYLQRRLTLYLGDGSFLAGLGLPVEDIAEALRPTDSVPLPGAAGLIPTNPVMLTAFEMLAESSVYFERPIEQIRSAKSFENLSSSPGSLGYFLREFVGYGEENGIPKTGINRYSEDHKLRPTSPAEAAKRMYLLKRMDAIQLIELHRKFRAAAFRDSIGEVAGGSGQAGDLERGVNIMTGAKSYSFNEKELDERKHRMMKNFLLEGWKESEGERFRGERTLIRREDQEPPREEYLQEQAEELLIQAPLEGLPSPN